MSSLLVPVCRIDEIIEHNNADTLEIVKLLGWFCVTKKGDFQVGDLVVYFPPDCVLPGELIERYDLSYLKNGGRTGSIKLRGVFSQGLVLGMDCLKYSNYKEGDNVADELGVTKWEVPERAPMMQGNPISKKKLNPYFDKYTGIENIKNYPTVFTEDDEVVITEKIHGSNARFGNLPIVIHPDHPLKVRLKLWFKKYILRETHEFVYGSHNVQLHGDLKTNNVYGEDMWGRVAKKYDLERKIPKDIIIYGEVFGKGVQDLVYGLGDIDLIIFDAKRNGKYLDYDELLALCFSLGLIIVPVLYVGKYSAEVVKEHTDGQSTIAQQQIREGCVIKSKKETSDFRIGRKILKSISEAYLLRKGGSEYK